MKKMTALSLIILGVSTATFAANSTINISARANNTMCNTQWANENKTDITSINNQTNIDATVLISTEKAFYDDSFIYDPITVNCNGQSTIVQPGSSIICQIEPKNVATIQNVAESFKHGSRGSYTVIR